MRKLGFLLLLAAIGPTAPGQTRVTVGQMEQLLASFQHQPDAKVARQLSGFELTERVTSDTLSRWETEFSGKRTQETLTALADASAFLDLPAADLPAAPPPELAAQEQIFSRIAGYVSKTLSKLPNFSALRTTTYFETSTPRQLLQQRQLQVYQLNNSNPSFRSLGPLNSAESKSIQLYSAGTWGVVVTYRDGLEVEDALSRNGKHAAPPAVGLTTKGEFGPILYVVLGDAIHGKVTWGHWERGTNELLAVFHYEVHRELSHFAVASGIFSPADYPAYHGEIAVDPASGTIFRITIEADHLPSDSMSESSILVEYGPVPIGGNIYICPVRAVATLKQPSTAADGSSLPASAPLQTFVNDVSFTKYHVFRSDARVLPGFSTSP
jgi:hypothetical protein